MNTYGLIINLELYMKKWFMFINRLMWKAALMFSTIQGNNNTHQPDRFYFNKWSTHKNPFTKVKSEFICEWVVHSLFLGSLLVGWLIFLFVYIEIWVWKYCVHFDHSWALFLWYPIMHLYTCFMYLCMCKVE